MAEKLGQDCVDKELKLTRMQSEVKDLKEKVDELNAANEDLNEENDEANTQLQLLRK